MNYMNRIGNVTNRFQTTAKRVLCLCSAGLLRSPTTANVLHREYGFNTRAAGVVDEYALIPVDDVLLYWADEVVCVEKEIHNILANKFDLTDKRVVVLNIPDKFEWNDIDLQNLIIKQYDDIKIMEKGSV